MRRIAHSMSKAERTAQASFFAGVPSRYRAVNHATIDWMLARPPLGHGFLNTKCNSVTLRDYGPDDRLAGPEYLYGWIQTRGLDALVHHAAAEGSDAPSSKIAAIARLRRIVPRLRDTNGSAYFCYDAASLHPLRLTAEGPLPQSHEIGIATPSDIYMATTLAVAAIDEGENAGMEVERLGAIVQAVMEKRFLDDETLPLSAASLVLQADPGFSPMTTLLGGALSLARRGWSADASFAVNLIERTLSGHLDPRNGLLRLRPGEKICDGGLSLEFSGFALGYCAFAGETGPMRDLTRLALSTFRHCFTGMAIPTWTSFDSSSRHSGLFPWWPLVETIRAAAIGFEMTGDEACLSLWQEAHYWRPEAALAYQMRNANGPIQYPPATPDLDSGYHTGLSLLDAIRVAERLTLGA